VHRRARESPADAISHAESSPTTVPAPSRSTRADPDFLYKLTIDYSDVLPASTPDLEAHTPLPATGPYMISRYVPGQVLDLRNPRFHEWSAAAQPSGYPNQIVIRLNLAGTQGAAAIADGKGEFMGNLGQIPSGYDGYFMHGHRDQIRVGPLMSTSYLALNVNAPPFNRLAVRRALNLAFDRREAVSAWGGPIAAKTACQVLPPGLPGYHPYCPYTRDPSSDGRWREPDLPEARRLVATSGTKGIKVTVWNTPGPPGSIGETKDAAAALRQLGYHASLRLLPDSTFFPMPTTPATTRKSSNKAGARTTPQPTTPSASSHAASSSPTTDSTPPTPASTTGRPRRIATTRFHVRNPSLRAAARDLSLRG
jgi:peptide/nickel transport system substrate-binding protein